VTAVDVAYTKSAVVVTTPPHTGVLINAPVAGVVKSDPGYGAKNYAPTVINAGVFGNTIEQMLARLNTDVIAQNPTVVIVEGGINDVHNGTDLTTFTTTANAIIANTQAALPGVRMMWMGCFCFGEQYPDPLNATINTYNNIIISACTSGGVAYGDVRTPQQAYEQANNLPSPGAISGLLCLDNGPGAYGVHPNNTLGIPMWSAVASATTTLNGTP